jgi:predicted metal-dependent enzyme (double-stranded beta helix superfamily)
VEPASQAVERLIRRLDAAAGLERNRDICAAVKQALIEEIRDRGLELPASVLRAAEDKYARHLLHVAANYAVVIMVWGPGQGTPIHDHDEKWCVECVYQGTIKVVSYDLQGSPGDQIVGFEKVDEVEAGRGSAGALIPPFDYHVIENPGDAVAVTIHVYGGEMHGCHTFTPLADGRYRKERRQLSYT